jgi:hypothetical protein
MPKFQQSQQSTTFVTKAVSKAKISAYGLCESAGKAVLLPDFPGSKVT